MTKKKPTILIVDDMQENLMLLSDILKEEYQIKIAKNGQKGLDIVHKGGVDLILLDVVMPQLDGYEVCTILQNDIATKQIPIVFVTANSSVEDEKKGFELGAVDYITKPFSPTTVKARVKTHLSLFLQTKQLQEQIETNKQKDILLQQQARVAALGEMIGNIAHQWRQPLSVITTAMSGLKMKHEYGMLQENDIDTTSEAVMQNAEFLSKTIDNFRNFFQKDQPKENFFIHESIVETVDILKASYENNFIKIETKLEKNIPYFGSKNLLSQVILNLLSNAKDALILRSIDNKTVSISLAMVENSIHISILDNGGGIAENIEEKIFDPYFTTKHQSQGTGLGLYMSRMILNTHFKGTLEMKNQELHGEKGACFTIKIENQPQRETNQ